jgi:hypothetical protein
MFFHAWANHSQFFFSKQTLTNFLDFAQPQFDLQKNYLLQTITDVA